MPASRKPRVGLVLGSGSARGWAHIGVLRALEEEGIKPDLVCGCSIGAFVGAAYANGELKQLETWVGSLTRQNVLSLLDVSWKSGLIKGEKLMQFFGRRFVDCDFAALSIPFACVATELQTGHETWLREGSVAQAVRASIATPGLLTPVMRQGKLLVDGAVVNPVPVSLCRAMGAELVIAVDLGSDIVGRAWRAGSAREVADEEPTEIGGGWVRRFRSRVGAAAASPDEALPSLVTVLMSSINIMQVRIARSRLAGDPADVLIWPRLAQLGQMDYHRGMEAIAEGVEAVRRALPALHVALGQ